MNRDIFRALVAEAGLAPSVHNIQPARWHIDDDGVTLLDDTSRRLPVGDPKGNDVAMSLGAAAEGLRLAASRAGITPIESRDGASALAPGLKPVMRFRFEDGGHADPLANHVATRQSFRGRFEPAGSEDRLAALPLAAADTTVLADADLVRQTALSLDAASWKFMARKPFRRELVSWMRLSRGHPRWMRDGLNAQAMAMNGAEAFGAGIVLGAAFPLLKALGLARPLLAEAATTQGAAAIVLFHRPAGEDRFVSGGHFYRLWLRIEAEGFGGAVLAALADDPETAAWLANAAGLPADHTLVSAFRIGRRPPGITYPRARITMDELIV